MSTYKRTAREIKVSEKCITNKNINVKIGTVENRDAPNTIYVFISFWLQPKKEYKEKEQEYLKSTLEREINTIYSEKLKPLLIKSEIFPKENENIFIKNIPDNLNYNDKRNFISIELYLHTCNILKKEKIPLSVKKNTEMFDEAITLSNLIGDSDLLNNKSFFEIQKKSS